MKKVVYLAFGLSFLAMNVSCKESKKSAVAETPKVIELKELSFVEGPKDFGLNVREYTIEEFFDVKEDDIHAYSFIKEKNKGKTKQELVEMIKANDNFPLKAFFLWEFTSNQKNIVVDGKPSGCSALLCFSECYSANSPVHNWALIVTDKYVYSFSAYCKESVVNALGENNPYVEYLENGGIGKGHYWKGLEYKDKADTLEKFLNDVADKKNGIPEVLIKWQSEWDKLISSIKIYSSEK